MKNQGGMILPITTSSTSTTLYLDQLQLSIAATFLLCLVGLKIEVIVRVLATSGTVFRLSSLKLFIAF